MFTPCSAMFTPLGQRQPAPLCSLLGTRFLPSAAFNFEFSGHLFSAPAPAAVLGGRQAASSWAGCTLTFACVCTMTQPMAQ